MEEKKESNKEQKEYLYAFQLEWYEGIILVSDTSRENSFRCLENWKKQKNKLTAKQP